MSREPPHGPSSTAPPRLRLPGAHYCAFGMAPTAPPISAACERRSTYHPLPGLDESVERVDSGGWGGIVAKAEREALSTAADWDRKGQQLCIEQESKTTADADGVFTEVDKDGKGYLTPDQVELATRRLKLPRMNRDSCSQWFVEMLELGRTTSPTIYRLHGDIGRILLARGVGQGKQTPAEVGPYENEDVLRGVFAEFGAVQSIKIRHRVQDGKNTSWAMVMMVDANSAGAVLSAPQVMIGKYRLRVTPFNMSTGQRSTGAMA
eukprot:COSAG01_NODE_14829_length_1405_cov_1.421899_1_plen_263_part_01